MPSREHAIHKKETEISQLFVCLLF